jgi:hypothetical protein
VAETITVSGEAPLVDTRSARAQTQYAAETLESLPGNGRLSTLISVLPGAVLNNEGDRASGALSDRSQTRFAIHGAPNAQPVIDGMNTEMAAANTGVFVWNGVTFQEVVAETTGIGADRDTGGVQLNMIPKDGGNIFSGTANFAYTGPDLQSNNIDDKLLARGLNASTTGLASIKKFVEAAVGVGGPIKRNKLWFFGAARKSITQQYAAGIYWNKLHQPQSMLYEPDFARRRSSNDFYRDYSSASRCRRREEQDRGRRIVPAQLQLRVRAVPAAGRLAGDARSGDRARIRTGLQRHARRGRIR